VCGPPVASLAAGGFGCLRGRLSDRNCSLGGATGRALGGRCESFAATVLEALWPVGRAPREMALPSTRAVWRSGSRLRPILLSILLCDCDVARDSPHFKFRVSPDFVARIKPMLTDISP
jgi:hypothetical protein